MKKLIIFCVWVMLTSGISMATSIRVGGSASLQTIDQALSKARKGDTLIFEPGLYKCRNIVIDKAITLIGKNGAILDGQEHTYILKIIADSVTVSGFEFKP